MQDALISPLDFEISFMCSRRIINSRRSASRSSWAVLALFSASILAKVARDDYIAELCAAEPDLVTRYDLLKNKGYGTKKHMDGIKQHGITKWHRKTFGICKEFA